MPRVPLVTLNNGVDMPMLGLGVYMTPGDQTARAVESALSAGYRMVDTAAAYGNEREVGEGVRRSGLNRSEVFVTTKLWMADYGYNNALRGFDASLEKLGLDYVDLYLLHWPAPSTFDATIEAYRAAEHMLAQGRTRAIGVCNFNPAHLERLAQASSIVPVLNQIELHPFFAQQELRAENARRNMLTQAWSPIGGIYINHPTDPSQITRVLDHPGIVDIAAKHGKTPAQVVLRWHIQHGNAVIPKSVNPERIRQNILVFDFALEQDDMRAIDAIDTRERGGRDPEVFDMEFIRARAAAAKSGQSAISPTGRTLT